MQLAAGSTFTGGGLSVVPGLYFTLPADRERGREMGRQMAAAAVLAGGDSGRALTRLYHSKNSFCVLNGGPYADALDALHGAEVAPGNGNFSKVRRLSFWWLTRNLAGSSAPRRRLAMPVLAGCGC